MTVSSEVSQVSYATDGVTTAFPVPFYFLANDHLRVWLYYESTGVETDLVLGSSYDVVGAGDPSGGTVTTTVAYPAGPQLRIERVVPITQETAYQRNDPFPERAHEQALDKLTMICQQLASFFGLLPGSTLRALLLGRNDVDGQGAYRARNNRIQDLGDPKANQDAVNWRSMFSFVTDYVDKAIAGVEGGFGWFQQSGIGSIFRTFQNKMREFLTARDKGAAGDGLQDDTLHLLDMIAEGKDRRSIASLRQGAFRTTLPIGMVPGGTLEGDGAQSTTIRRYGSGNLISSPFEDDAVIRGLTLDMRRSVTGGDGHGVSATGQRLWADALVVRDFGSGGVGGGTGVLFEGGASKTAGHRLTNSSFYGNPAATVSFGWIFADTLTSFASGVYSQDIVGYGHELKNDARYNNLTHLIARLCNWALAYGQDTPGVDGCDFNVATGVVGMACDAGLIVGEGTYNLFSGLLFDQTGAPGREADRSAVRLSGSAAGNAAFGVMSYGTYTQSVFLSGNRNYVQLAAHDTSATVLRIGAGSRQNAVEISHPGLRTSIFSAIDDSSGQALDGSTANAVWCHATGQRIGSISGSFHDRLGISGAAINGNHRWRYEHSQYAIHAFATPGNSGDSAGLVYAIPGSAIHGKILYAKGASGPADYWSIGVNAADAYYLTPLSIRPNPDNTKSCGEATYRWTVVYATTTTISSSDARLKKIRGPLTEAEMRAWAKVQPVIYQWLDAIADKGEDGARLHGGYIAQDVESAFTSEGLDPRRYAMFCEDDVFNTVKVKQMVSRQRFASETVRVPRIEVADGRAVQTFVDETTEIPLYEDIPLVDVDGNAVLDEKGNAVMHQVPAMHDVEEEVEQQVPAGKRLALRYDHCAVFEAAYQRKRADLIEARVTALEARP
ncbi:tail fiber domain-containing protein [Achromobacter insolitus]|uniref:tail fiber domain-containing protein n=1 Tax=Achromobacter insolitus TaxID=217204 RepID=UPI0020A42DE7|nr:tail fiber domain-containing protein [Achromobacter insolitus]MCP1404420.1 hypothetical protein [Achromobacter insolitus]